MIAPNGPEIYESDDDDNEEDDASDELEDNDPLDVQPSPRHRIRRCSYPVRPVESHRSVQPQDLLVTTTMIVERRGETAHARTVRVEMDRDAALTFAAFELQFELDDHVDGFGLEVS